MRLSLLSYFNVTKPNDWINWEFGTQVSAQAIAYASPLELSSVESRNTHQPSSLCVSMATGFTPKD